MSITAMAPKTSFTVTPLYSISARMKREIIRIREKLAETGEGEGEGFTMNVPIKGKKLAKREGTGAQVIDAFRHPLTEAMKQFRPEFILISCGFDGHKDDPLGGFDLTNEDYATLTSCVNQIAHQYAKGRVVSVLEGGYNLEAIAAASVSHVRALMKGV